MSFQAKILAVGGGGGSSTAGSTPSGYGCGGGGGGQVSYNATASLTLQSYTITVDPGGAGGSAGGTSSFGSVVTAAGGGVGSTGAGGASGSSKAGGSAGTNSGGGGGGDSAVGSGGGSGTGGAGGNGTSNSISGSAVTYGGGGGGGGFSGGASGGTGGGGNGGHHATSNATNGTANTGGGGGGGGATGDTLGAGGSGIVIISVITASFPVSSVTASVSPTTSGSNTIWTFTSSGTFSFPNTAYWVGGTANWDGSSTANWAYTSGGTAGAPVPTSTTPVYFDANSGSGTVTISATANCSNLTTTGSTVNITGSNALNVYGNLTLITSVLSSYTGTLTFASTSSGQTITGATNNLGTVIFNGSGGVWTMQDSWSAVSVTLTAGTLIAGANGITLTGTGTVWSANGGAFTCGTSVLEISNTSSTGKTFSGGGLTYYSVYFLSGTGIFTISGSNTFNTLRIISPPCTVDFTAGTTQTLSSSNFLMSGTAGNLNVLQSTSTGTQWKIASASTISIDYVSLEDSDAIFL